MKQHLRFLTAALALFILVFSACTKNANEALDPKVTITEETLLQMEVTEENFDWWAQEYEELLGQEITVEHATLEEVNAVMIANDLEPFTQSDVEKAQARSLYQCSTWNLFIDFDGNGVANSNDVAAASQFLCNSSVGCNGSLSTPGYARNVRFFGSLSYLGNQVGLTDLNNDDMNTAMLYLFGVFPCL